MKKEAVLLIVLACLIPSVISAVNLTYSTDKEGFKLDVYDCKSDCSANTNPDLIGGYNSVGNNAGLAINSSRYLTASYKQCFQPLLKEEAIDNSFENKILNYSFSKKENCFAVITPLTVSGSRIVGGKLTIITRVNSFHTASENSPYEYMASLSNKKEFYTGSVNLDFYAGDEIVEARAVELGVDESEQASFEYISNTKGEIVFKIVSNADDCKCLNKEERVQEININITEPYVYVQEQSGIPQIVFQETSPSEKKADAGVLPESVSGCEKDGICHNNCIGGDPDCRCTREGGHICGAGEECDGEILRCWEGGVCCAKECVKSAITSDTGNIKPLESLDDGSTQDIVIASNKIAFTITKGMQYAIGFIIITIILFSVFVSFTLHHFGEEVEFVVGAERKIKKGTEESITFLEKEAEKAVLLLKKKTDAGKSSKDFRQVHQDELKGKADASKKAVKSTKASVKYVKLNPLILKIIDTLYGDEKDVFKIILDNEGIKKDDLQERMGYDRIRMEQALLKLDRKQLIKKKGSDDNCMIYVHEWLK